MVSPTTNSNTASGVQSTPSPETLVQNWWLFLLRGIFGIVFGLIALIFPGPTMLSLVIVFSAYMLIDGVAGIISAVVVGPLCGERGANDGGGSQAADDRGNGNAMTMMTPSSVRRP